MRVIHFVTGGFSGATQVAVDLCSAAAPDQNIRVKLVLRQKKSTSLEKIESLRANGIDVELVPGWSHLATILSLRSICKRWRPDVLMAHGFSEHIWGRLAGLLAGVPILVHVEHNSRERYTPWRLHLSRWLARKTAAIVGVSEGVKSRLLELGFPPEKCHAIPNGIPWTLYQGLRLPDWKSRTPSVVMAARFARQKDHATLLDSLSFLKKKNVLVPLYLAGTGKKNIIRQSQSLADRLGLSETVHFLGRVEKMPNLLMQHRIFVLSSHYEGMPLALLEAMACGCACIGTDVVGIREVIEHDRTGILVPEGNPQALADAIVSLITHPERAEALGLAARQTAKKRFASDLMHARYAQLLSHLHTQHLESRPSKK